MNPSRSSSQVAVAWIWALPSLVIAFVAAVVVGPGLVRSPDPGRIFELFLDSVIYACTPEPVEQVQYVLVIALWPLIFLAGLLVSRRRPDRESAFLTRLALGSQLILAAGALAVWVYSRVFVYPHFREFPFLIAGLSILGLRKPMTWLLDKVAPNHWGFGVATFVYFGLKFLPSVLTTGGLQMTPRHVSFHVSFTLNEFAAVAGGLHPLVDFHPQYQNVMPCLLAPIFRSTGISVTSFSFVMLALTVGLVLCVVSIFRRVTGSWKRTFVLIVPFLAMCTVPFMRQRGMHANAFTYYAVGPMRYFFPFLTAFLCSSILLRNRPRDGVGYFIAFTVATIGAINNLDFGIPSLVALAAALGITQRRWNRLAIFGSAGVATGIALVSALVLAESGRWPDWSQLAEFQHIFAVYGFLMLPLPGVGLYWIVIATFFAALAIPLSRWVRGSSDDGVERRHLDGLLVYSAVFGCGAMMYYVGRSHDQVLIAMFPAWAFSFLLLLSRQDFGRVLSSWKSVGALERTPLVLTGALYVMMLTTIVSKFPSAIAQIDRIGAENGSFERRFAAQVGVLQDLSAPNEEIMVIAPFGHMLANQAGRRNVFPYAEGGALILRRQFREVERTIENRRISHVFGTFSEELKTALAGLGFKPGVPRAELEIWSR